MKRCLSALLIFVLLISSAGIPVYSSVCKMKNKTMNCCEKKNKSGCCKTEIKLIKLEQNYFSSNVNHQKNNIGSVFILKDIFNQNNYFSNCFAEAKFFKPPKIPAQINFTAAILRI